MTAFLRARPLGLSAAFAVALASVACAQSTGIGPGGSGGGAGGSGAVGGSGGGSVDASQDVSNAGASGAATDAGPTDSGGDANPCSGVVCNSPPVSKCSGSSLEVYEAVGTCGANGQCTYKSSTTACPNGCSNGACTGDPCIGVSCNSAPPNTCTDASHLTTHQSPGTCDSTGQCSYSSVQAYCPFGCQNDVCQGDPCAGVTCNSPPASYCKDASYLTVYDTPGTCTSSGACSYPNTHDVYCSFGCAGTQCTNDPCAGKVCSTPPAANCKDANTARTYSSSGTCSNGLCSYPETDTPCPYGCVNGVCRDCQVNGDCPAGNYCQSGTCMACGTSQHCGTACTDCTQSGQVCSGGQCVECTGSGMCSSGKYCENNTCVACNTDAHCGSSCTACSSGTSCNGSSCVACNTDQKCGPSCTACGGSTPHCKDQGASSVCVECLSNGDCSGGETCDTASGTCKPPCPSTLTSVFSDDFSAPSSSSWTTGSAAPISSSQWHAYTKNNHGVRIYNGRLEISNDAGSSAEHGQGYAYVPTGGSGSVYDNSLYNPVLKQNAGESVVWTFNMRRDNADSTNGGFSCTSTGSQNYRTIGLAYVLATDSANGLDSSAGTCSSSASGKGYAVVLGGSTSLRLVRFSGGLRNGAISDLVTSSGFSVSNYFSVRVTYNATNDQWTLEARSDGGSSFSNPSSGSYSFTGSATDATYVNDALDYAGPYFQTGCCCLCSSTYTARFDNVGVGVRCAP